MIKSKVKTVIKRIPHVKRILEQRDHAFLEIERLQAEIKSSYKKNGILSEKISTLTSDLVTSRSKLQEHQNQKSIKQQGFDYWWREAALFDARDLGEINPEFKGIYTAGYSEEEITQYMTAAYNSTKGADDLAAILYNNYDFFDIHTPTALKKTTLEHRTDQKVRILDIGCGLGISTLSLIKIFPKAEILATELSPYMLKVFRDKLVADGIDSNCTLMQLNAEKLYFKENTFDLVLGAAILHHLLYPELVFKACEKILKEDGYAIFFEPFEYGYGVSGLLLKSILNDPRSHEIAPSVKEHIHALVTAWKKHIGKDKSDPYFQTADDKWIFSIKYLAEQAGRFNLEVVRTFSLVNTPNPFRGTIESIIKSDQLPSWAWQIIDEGTEHFSLEARQELLSDGCLVLRKKKS